MAITKEDVENCTLTRKEIAQKLNISYFTFCNRVNGFSNFSSNEERILRTIFNENRKSELVN